MSNEQEPWYGDMTMSVLLAAARRTYTHAIGEALHDSGFDDLPRRGPFILGAIINRGHTLAEATRFLSVSKQAASQLVDSLVLRGYLDRATDPADRRRIVATPTERGQAAAQVTRETVADVDAALIEKVGAEAVATARAVLGAMVELRHE